MVAFNKSSLTLIAIITVFAIIWIILSTAFVGYNYLIWPIIFVFFLIVIVTVGIFLYTGLKGTKTEKIFAILGGFSGIVIGLSTTLGYGCDPSPSITINLLVIAVFVSLVLAFLCSKQRKNQTINLWKIFIVKMLAIGFVLFLLLLLWFSTAVYNCGARLGTACIASPGYFCENPVLSTGGNLSFIFAQNNGKTIYNIAFSCSTTQNANGPPIEGLVVFNSIGSSGNDIGSINNYTLGTSLANGQEIRIGDGAVGNGLPCKNNGELIGPNASIGTQVSGYVWLAYTNSSGPPSQSNEFVVTKTGTFSLKVT